MDLYKSEKIKELIKILFSIALLVLISLSLQKVFFQPKDLPDTTKLRNFGPLPQGQGQTLSGELISLPLSQPTLIVFWAQWCPLCISELPDLDRIQKKYKDRGLKIVMINVDKKEDQSKAQKIWMEKDRSPIALFSISKSFLKQLPVKALPHHILIDQQGVQKLAIPGIINWRGAKINSLIERLLKP